MNFVEPIKSKSLINNMKEFLFSHSARDYCLFVLGINTGIKLQDLLLIHVKDVVSNTGEVFEYLHSNSHPELPIYLNHHVRESIRQCIHKNNLQVDDYLFKSRKTSDSITRQQAYRVINEAAKHAGISESVGTTTLRKTFGYHAYKKGIAISLIQKRLHHSTPAETLHFLGIQKKSAVEVKLDVNL
ncbi:tyrosine-type recombinase/integrase [Peribacillus acanthi]|uniref:tyrosine-type recombinase/integrase n=1 Tax=Peribacillus acanthi TaxID=2171554 RepID=UPI000D3E087C|nr:tyrosine-type recombinase/integrase [Peribacillus acanthi]